MSLPSRCPLCQAGPDHQGVVTPWVYGGAPGQAFFHCEACDVRYLFPPLTQDEAMRFYAAEFSGFMEKRSGEGGGWDQPERHVRANQSQWERRWRYLADHLPPQGRVLEIGCSSGFMLYPLEQKGLECLGVEPSGVFGAYVRARGLACYDDMDALVAAGAHEAGFDLIMHFFVLEHMVDPVAAIARQMAMLRPGGRLVFEIPNCADALRTVYDLPAFERFYWSVAHNWYFSEDSTRHLLERLSPNVEILRDQRYDLSNHMVWARDGKPGGMGRFTPVWGEEVERQYREALIASGHCDTLVAILHKD
ncbi:MAG: class I SAM-dependent methyltransferase [Phaeospirillum sp.]|nr:class I SAM-dependent methyltransferase [Phaeospirillum sp.]